MTDGVQKVRFPESYATVNEERIELAAGMLRDRNRGGMRKAIGRTDDVSAEDIPGVEPVAARWRQRHLARLLLG